MNEKAFRILIPVFAVVVIVESLVLISKLTKKPVVVNNNTVVKEIQINKPINFVWSKPIETVKTGVTTNLPLSIVSVDKKIGIDAIDLYIKYDPNIVDVLDVSIEKGFPTPSFKKINKDKGMIVLNFLVNDVDGYVLEKGQTAGLLNIKANFVKSGVVDFTFGDATLVVENTTAKVLPFNSEKLVVNVTR